MTIKSAFIAFALLCSPAFGQSYMTPATGLADFENPGNSVIEWAFPVEVLWQVTNGKAHIHFEAQTKAYTHTDGVTYGPGTFVKGTASGKFIIELGADLPATAPQFWWPPDATSQQPPDKNGQSIDGTCNKTVGLSSLAVAQGYTDLVPSIAMADGQLYAVLYLKGLGKPLKPLTAAYFIESGEIQIHCDAFYMVGQ